MIAPSTEEDVLCIADSESEREGDRRRCFWKRRVPCSLLSIHDKRDYEILPILKKFKVVICNYDVANGAAEYHSRETLDYFNHRGQKDIKEYVSVFRKDGGRFISEMQAIKGIPSQTSYDAIFGTGELTVFSGETRNVDSTSVRWDDSNKYHPILRNLAPVLTSQYRPRGEPVFTNHPELSESAYERYPERIYWGWFTDWGKGWSPLLWTAKSLSDGHQFPVMLAKYSENRAGEYIATTMRIANSEICDFISNLVVVDQVEISDFYRRAYTRMNWWGVGLCGAALLLYATLDYALYTKFASVLNGGLMFFAGICFFQALSVIKVWNERFSLVPWPWEKFAARFLWGLVYNLIPKRK